MTLPLLLNLAETARQLGQVSTKTVRRMIASGELPSVKVRGSVKVPVARRLFWRRKPPEMAPDNNCSCLPPK